MKQMLARFGAGAGADHRAVFKAFARGLMSTLARRPGAARVRVVRG